MPYPITIGCDVSKQKIDICILEDGKAILHASCIQNTKEGLKKFIEKCTTWTNPQIILEPTGYYHYLFAIGLRDAGFDVRLVNPYVMKQYSKLGIRKTKTDKVDARRLATIANSGIELRPYTETLANIQQKARIQALHHLQDTQRSLKQRAHQIEELHGIIGELQDVRTAFSITMKHLDTQIARLKKRIEQEVTEDAKLIASIPGIGIGSACAILGAIGDHTRFSHRDKLTAFAGLDPSIMESGTSVHGKSRLSKRGSTMLRRVLGQCAWGAMIHNPRMQLFYEKKKAEGMHYFSILMAIARKLLNLIHAMLRSQRPYDPNFVSTRICLTPV